MTAPHRLGMTRKSSKRLGMIPDAAAYHGAAENERWSGHEFEREHARESRLPEAQSRTDTGIMSAGNVFITRRVDTR
jgi:hypothetical protein